MFIVALGKSSFILIYSLKQSKHLNTKSLAQKREKQLGTKQR